MPFLAWTSAHLPRHHELDGDCVLGRDPDICGACLPDDASVSRRHAQLFQTGNAWWIRDLGSRNGTLVDGHPVLGSQGQALADGALIQLGDWSIRYSLAFPDLDPNAFAEHIGDLFSEVDADPTQALKLVKGMEMLQRSTEAIFRETEAMAMVQSLLNQALRLLGADRGFVAMVGPDRSLQSVHRVGEVEEAFGLSRSVLDYVLIHRTGVLSNAPLSDPRFGGMSLMELRRGPLLCVPLDTGEEVLGVLYLDRDSGDPPFTRFDLALFQSFVRQGTLALRHDQLARKAFGLAEMEGELARYRAAFHDASGRREDLLASLESPIRWALRICQDLEGALPLQGQLEHLAAVIEAARTEENDPSRLLSGAGESLVSVQARLGARWAPLMASVGARFTSDPAPEGKVWIARSEGILALESLLEPMLAQVPKGGEAHMNWQIQPGGWVANVMVPWSTQAPSPDAWTQRMLRDSGLSWQWLEPVLKVQFQEGTVPSQNADEQALLGLVNCGEDLAGFFEEVAEAQSLTLHALQPEPPLPPIPAHRLVVIDVRGLPDAVETVRAYRRHPAFTTCPILVLRVNDDCVPDLLGAGATDWLPVGFRWEALHHRLQALRSHEELQKNALTAERLDSFRMLAGTLKHEINNPLAVMSMQVELLERKYPEEPKLAKIAEMIDRIQGLVQVLQKMREATPEAYADGSKILKLS